jgi:hypothetical protein
MKSKSVTVGKSAKTTFVTGSLLICSTCSVLFHSKMEQAEQVDFLTIFILADAAIFL